MFASMFSKTLCLLVLAGRATAFPVDVDLLIKDFGAKYLLEGKVPEVAKTVAVMKEGKVHMHVDLMGYTHEFLLEPTSVFSKDLTISVIREGGSIENRQIPMQYSYHVVDERNAEVHGTAIVHENGYNKILTYMMNGKEYVLDGFGVGFDSGYSYFYAVNDVRVDPDLRDDIRLPPTDGGGRRSVSSKKANVQPHTGTTAPLMIRDKLPESTENFGHYGHAGHMGGHLGRRRRAVPALKVAELVIDLDVEFVSQFGSIEEAIVDMADNINAVNEFYLSSGIIHTIKSITVRTPEAPQYTGLDPDTLLVEVYDAHLGSTDDDITILITGREWSSPYIKPVGLAYSGTVCWDDYNVGVAQLLFTRLQLAVMRVQLIAHELGHSWGCSHVEEVPENEIYVMYPSVEGRETAFGPTCLGNLVGQQLYAPCLSLMASEEACAISPCVTGTCSVLHVGAEDHGVSESFCTCPSGFSGELCEINIDDCVNNACTSNAMGCVDGVDSYTCTCLSGFDGEFCQHDIDDCVNNPCGENGSCVDKVDAFECICARGWEGQHCQNDINDCDPNPCANGGTCTDVGVEAFTCSCVAGYTGALCSTVIDNCSPQSCNERGTCSSRVNAYDCVCDVGFEGKDCEINIDDCLTNPCANGHCHDLVNDYRCECVPGWEGRDCTIDIDDCAANPCQQGGTCVDAVNGYSCACVEGFSGKNCEVWPSGCIVQPCMNGGQCADAGTQGEYVCECTGTGYQGTNCQEDIIDCIPGYCQNDGICNEGVNLATCDCVAGYIGTNCETFNCPNVCFNGASCTGTADNIVCVCAEGYEGANCAQEINECASTPCANAGTCTDLLNAYECTCALGYSGDNCGNNINECDPNPCQNGANCMDGVNGYTCICNPGFTGTDCEININDCEHQDCQNGAVCIDGIDSFSCDCDGTGFKGEFCNENIDDCINNPCGQHGYQCIDGVNTFTCQCNAGYTGITCQEDINECLTLAPCQNDATCINTDGHYECDCAPGYGGKDCAVLINNCKPDTCQNGGVCVNGINSYTCDCASGFSGEHCQNDIDDCEGVVCVHGTCKDFVGAYKCECELGYAGDFCEVNIDDCRGVTCSGKGTCVDGIHSHTCECFEGYSGNYCERHANHCAGVQCVHGECEDGVDTFECVCEDGYSGEFCEHDNDDCIGVTCANGGICVDGVNSHTCQCGPGSNCEVEARDLLQGACVTYGECQNGGKCVVDEITGAPMCKCLSGNVGEFCESEMSCPICENRSRCIKNWRDNTKVCLCRAGYYGLNCVENSNRVGNACNKKPCGWRGQCVNDLDEEESFRCDCYNGWTGHRCKLRVLLGDEECVEGRRGEHCEIDINECLEDNPCVNGKCKNRREYGKTYVCRCDRGWMGKNCDVPIPANP